MSNLKEQVAYLQGLTTGLNLNEHSAEGKMLLKIVDVLDSVADELQCVNAAQEDLETYMETIDEDLTELEDEVYEVDYEDLDEDSDFDEYVDELDDDDIVEVACPVCHEDVTFEADLLDEDDPLEVTCPHCGGVVYDNTLAFDDDDDEMMPIRHTMHPGV